LRQPLEDGQVTITRAAAKVTFPADFLLVAAMNPCPCGYLNDPKKECRCSSDAVERYLGKISGPLLDRIDIHLDLQPLTAAQLITSSTAAESSAAVAERVAKARAAAAARWSAGGWRTNAEVPGPQLRRPPWRLPAADTAALRAALERGQLSARGFDRVLRLAWSIADLDGRDRPTRADVDEAVQLRRGDDRAPGR
jgi:magnesium chelatase family protein